MKWSEKEGHVCVCIIIPPSFSPSLSSRDMMMEFAER